MSSLLQGLNTQGGVVTRELNAPLLAAEVSLPQPYPRGGGGGGGWYAPRPVPIAADFRDDPQPAQPPHAMAPVALPVTTAAVSPWLYVVAGLSVGLVVGLVVGVWVGRS